MHYIPITSNWKFLPVDPLPLIPSPPVTHLW